MNRDYINNILRENLKESRLKHVYGVVETAKKLAEIYGENPEKAEEAALFHDMYKGLTEEESDFYVRRFNLDQRYLGNRNLAHSQIAAEMMKREFKITDQDLINAVKYHTTGRAGMSNLEKIIYIADATEAGRVYPGVEDIREMSFQNLDAACMMSLDRTAEFVKSNGNYLDPDTEYASEYFHKMLKVRREDMTSKEKAMLIADLLDRRKAGDIQLIDITEKSSFADYLVIATGNSDRQVKALCDDVEEEFAKNEIMPKNIEGKNGSGWILMDYNDIIVNVFTEDMRGKYSLEKVWGDCPFVNPEE